MVCGMVAWCAGVLGGVSVLDEVCGSGVRSYARRAKVQEESVGVLGG